MAAAPPLSQRVASLRASLLDTLHARDAAATSDTHPNGALLLDAIPLARQHVVRALRHQPAQMLLDSAWVCTALQGLAPPSAVASSSPAPSHSRTPLASLMALAAAGTLGALAAGHSSAAGDGAHTQRVALARVAVATSLSYLLMLVTSLSWSRAATRRPRRSTAVLLAAISVGATLHPALGFLLMTLARPHRVAPLALLASAALLPGAAAWWRRGPREPAALYSADAREGLLCLLALVVASLKAAAASARRWLVGAIGARRGAQLRRRHAPTTAKYGCTPRRDISGSHAAPCVGLPPHDPRPPPPRRAPRAPRERSAPARGGGVVAARASRARRAVFS